MTINIATCDDDIVFLENTMRKVLSNAARRCEIKINVKFFTDGTKLLNDFRNGVLYDVVILDIEMPHINGKQLAERLRLIDASFDLIFITSYKMEIFNTIQYSFKTFIQKVDDIQNIENELVRVFKECIANSPQYEVFDILRDGLPSTYRIPVCNIMAFYLVDKIAYLKTTTEELVLQEKIFNKIVEKYADKGFYETYRNYIVNISKVKEIKDNCVILNNDEKLPLSKRNKKPLLKALNEYVMIEVDK